MIDGLTDISSVNCLIELSAGTSAIAYRIAFVVHGEIYLAILAQLDREVGMLIQRRIDHSWRLLTLFSYLGIDRLLHSSYNVLLKIGEKLEVLLLGIA